MNYWLNNISFYLNFFFDIFEINYGDKEESIFSDKNLDLKKHKHYFFVENFKTHTEGMIYLLNKCFYEYDYDIVFNTNIDDYYSENRFKYQLMDIEINNSYLIYIKFNLIIER